MFFTFVRQVDNFIPESAKKNQSVKLKWKLCMQKNYDVKKALLKFIILHAYRQTKRKRKKEEKGQERKRERKKEINKSDKVQT